jgi:DNA-directed RNA polymerase subunit K/omega
LALHAMLRDVASGSDQCPAPIFGLTPSAHADGGALIMTEPMGKFEFARLSSLRAAQLMRGCVARVPEKHKRTTTAQHEVAAGKILALPRDMDSILPRR